MLIVSGQGEREKDEDEGGEDGATEDPPRGTCSQSARESQGRPQEKGSVHYGIHSICHSY